MEVLAASATPTERFSRYRSVRKAAAAAVPRAEPAGPNLETIPGARVPETAIHRGPSRYRKTATPLVHKPSVPVPLQPAARPDNATITTTKPQGPSLLASPSAHITDPVTTPRSKDLDQTVSPSENECNRSTERTQVASRYPARRVRSRTTTSPPQHTQHVRRSHEIARAEARMMLEGEYDRLQRLKDQQRLRDREQRKRTEAKLAEQKMEEARLEEGKVVQLRAAQVREEQERAQKRAAKEMASQQRSRKWTISGRSTSAERSSPSGQILQQETSPTQADGEACQKLKLGSSVSEPVVQYHDAPRLKSLSQPLRHNPSTKARRDPGTSMPTYEPKLGDGPPKTANNVTVPAVGADAPVSAVNAGERRVEIRYEKSTITLPITPTTTVKDLLNSASVIMSQPIDPRTSVLVENFVHMGLERPLRRYERIRDVMNSWDSDGQNHLTILPESDCAATGLEQKDAPSSPSHKIIVQMNHSQKTGKWNKHWLVLRSDGQVTCSNKENDVDAANAFHLSDFDIYMPTNTQIKRLKPPKKICFAIKSQQRAIMFESTDNFVHYFCTNDKAIADNWYNSVQAWRSYYLVNVLGEGVTNKVIPTNALEAVAAAAEPRPSTSQSRDSIPYQLGTFESLLDFSVDNFRYSLQNSLTNPPVTNSTSSHARNKSTSGPKNAGRASVEQSRSNGNLQHTSTVKRGHPPLSNAQPRTLVEQSTNKPLGQDQSRLTTAPILGPTDGAFTGKGLLASAFDLSKPRNGDETSSPYDNTDEAFTGKGLLSRTFSKRRAPQPETGTLLNVNDDTPKFTGSGLLSRTLTTKKSSAIDSSAEIVPENTDEAFTGGGLMLLQRKLTKKKSKIKEGRLGQPLIDLGGDSTFQDGSLLRQVESHHGAQGPVIDRGKYNEIHEKVGEGY